jgi:hypothetical protein
MKMYVYTYPNSAHASYCNVGSAGKTKEDAIENLTATLDEISGRWFKGKVVDIEEVECQR